MVRAAWVALLLIGACSQKSGPGRAVPAGAAHWEQERLQMVSEQIEARGVRDARVLDAMRRVPRHRFVPEPQRAHAYDDRPLPIGEGQTISQPYIVALMSELANLGPGDRVLEVGTGCGYQAAVLAEMGVEVLSIEIIESLALRARATLSDLGYGPRVQIRHGDGYAGWPERAPFDAIIVTAAPPTIPEPLKQQLAPGGRLVIPVGELYQSLLLVTRTRDGFREESVVPVRFVPMTGKAQQR
ncbi:MAG: protein-L-isoaspartate(D-aspartate) O-methyltransferase [Polyangiales bacterium]